MIFTPSALLSESSGLYFFIIYKENAPSVYLPVYKSETKKPTGDKMMWNQVQIGSTDLCKDDVERPIKIEFFRSSTSGKHSIVGSCTTVTLG